jgi:transcriptional regulator with XRE-family HTH domain
MSRTMRLSMDAGASALVPGPTAEPELRAASRGTGFMTDRVSEMRDQEEIKARQAAESPPGTGEAPRSEAALRAPSAARRSTTRTQDIDRHVGARVRERRIMLGLTQQQLADLIGVTYQQAHKYERAINRISAGRLFEIAQVLGVPVSYFFAGLEQDSDRSVTPRERMCLELARNFAQIPNERHQEALSQLARVLATD